MRHSPCLGCDEKYENCHSLCEDFLEFDRAHKEEKEKIRKAKERDSITFLPREQYRYAKGKHGKVFKQRKGR